MSIVHTNQEIENNYDMESLRPRHVFHSASRVVQAGQHRIALFVATAKKRDRQSPNDLLPLHSSLRCCDIVKVW
jgi:hypothetical protein